MRDILAVNNAGGGDPPTEKLLTAETTIFILHQQLAFYMKAVILMFHLTPW